MTKFPWLSLSGRGVLCLLDLGTQALESIVQAPTHRKFLIVGGEIYTPWRWEHHHQGVGGTVKWRLLTPHFCLVSVGSWWRQKKPSFWPLRVRISDPEKLAPEDAIFPCGSVWEMLRLPGPHYPGAVCGRCTLHQALNLTLYTLSHLTFQTTLWEGYYYWFHFKNEKTEA